MKSEAVELHIDGHGAGSARWQMSQSSILKFGQRLRRAGGQEIWDSVWVYAKEVEDGTLVVQVLVCNPDWDEALQIASIKSRPRDAVFSAVLGCNVDHVTP